MASRFFPASRALVRYATAIHGEPVLLRLANKHGKLAMVPPFPSITVKNAREVYITESEFAALQIELPEEYRDLAGFYYYGGFRRDEALRLTWGCVNVQPGMIVLPGNLTKNGEPRIFPFHNYPDLRAVLERQRARTDRWELEIGREIPLVFTRAGEPIRDFYHAWRSACRRAGAVTPNGRPKRLHDMRRSAARRMEQAGIPRSVSRKLLGHKTTSIFERYAVVASHDLEAGTAKLAALRHSEGIVEPEIAHTEAIR